MARKKHDGIGIAIIVLNVLIVGVIVTLCVLIYLYMSGKLEDTNVANLGQETQTSAALTTTAITTLIPETTTTTTIVTTEEFIIEGDEDETTVEDTIVAIETDVYDDAFFENDLFIGDSIATGLFNYGYFKSEQVFAKVGLNPESALTDSIDDETAIEKAERLKPKRIYIMLGSNGLAYMGNTYMTQQMKLLVEALQEASPDSYIYILSIPPVTKEHESEGQETMVMVNGYNKLLKDLADEIGVVYLDLCSELEDTTGYFSEKYAEADGMHFLGTAYKKMLSFIEKKIQG